MTWIHSASEGDHIPDCINEFYQLLKKCHNNYLFATITSIENQ